METHFAIKTSTPRDRRPIKIAEIDPPDPVDAPRYPVYCLTLSEHRDIDIIRLSFFLLGRCHTKKKFPSGFFSTTDGRTDRERNCLQKEKVKTAEF